MPLASPALAGAGEPFQCVAYRAKGDRNSAVITIDEHRFEVSDDLSLAFQMVSRTERGTGSACIQASRAVTDQPCGQLDAF